MVSISTSIIVRRNKTPLVLNAILTPQAARIAKNTRKYNPAVTMANMVVLDHDDLEATARMSFLQLSFCPGGDLRSPAAKSSSILFSGHSWQ